MILKIKRKIYKYKINKKHFNFGKNIKYKIAKIYLRKTWSNIFLTLTDIKNKVIICKTSGTSKVSDNKRRKKVSQAIEKIMIYIKYYLTLYKIKNISIILKMRVKSHLYVLIKRLKYYNINIINIISKKNIPHNGIRKKKIRRI